MNTTQSVIIGTALLKAAVFLICVYKIVRCADRLNKTWRESLKLGGV